MKRLVTVAAVIAAVAAVHMSAFAGLHKSAFADEKAVKKEIEAAYKKLEAAMKAKDINGLVKMTADGFTLTEPGRQPRNAEQAKLAIQQQFVVMKSIDQVTMTVTKLTVSSGTAVAMTSGKSVMSMYGPNGTTDKIIDLRTSRDTWVKGPEGWKLKSIEVSTDKLTKNGQPFDPAKAALEAMGGGPRKKK